MHTCLYGGFTHAAEFVLMLYVFVNNLKFQSGRDDFLSPGWTSTKKYITEGHITSVFGESRTSDLSFTRLAL